MPLNEDPRTLEIAERLNAVHERIDTAVTAAGRPEKPKLIVVTKYFPAEDVTRLCQLGIRDVGENKDQEASAKAEEVSAALEQLGELSESPRWHFIGQLQSNKAKSVIQYAHSVHSVDRMSLVKALRKAAQRRAEERAENGHPACPDLDCLIQVDLRQDIPADGAGRGGASPSEIPGLAEAIEEAPGLQVRGLMAVAPLDEPAAPAFERLAGLSEQLRADHPGAGLLSAGMSGDLEEAVAAGATHLRIGRDVLGDRPYPR